MKSPLVGATLLVGIDFSECCERALGHAVTLAEQNQGKLALVHVMEWEGVAAGVDGLGTSALDEADSPLRKALAGQAQAFLGRLGQFSSHLVADRVPAQLQVVIGEPAAGLLFAAERSAASFVVLGAQGRSSSPLRTHRVIGSTAEQVCEKSPIPVLLASWPDLAQGLGQRYLFLSSPDPSSWSCSRCGAVLRSGVSARVCVSCGDPSGTWISLPEIEATFASAASGAMPA